MEVTIQRLELASLQHKRYFALDSVKLRESLQPHTLGRVRAASCDLIPYNPAGGSGAVVTPPPGGDYSLTVTANNNQWPNCIIEGLSYFTDLVISSLFPSEVYNTGYLEIQILQEGSTVVNATSVVLDSELVTVSVESIFAPGDNGTGVDVRVRATGPLKDALNQLGITYFDEWRVVLTYFVNLCADTNNDGILFEDPSQGGDSMLLGPTGASIGDTTVTLSHEVTRGNSAIATGWRSNKMSVLAGSATTPPASTTVNRLASTDGANWKVWNGTIWHTLASKIGPVAGGQIDFAFSPEMVASPTQQNLYSTQYDVTGYPNPLRIFCYTFWHIPVFHRFANSMACILSILDGQRWITIGTVNPDGARWQTATACQVFPDGTHNLNNSLNGVNIGWSTNYENRSYPSNQSIADSVLGQNNTKWKGVNAGVTMSESGGQLMVNYTVSNGGTIVFEATGTMTTGADGQVTIPPKFTKV